ncbi:hypothetical protein [Sansalvadorimonas verongulae]|uniref:hypothetical protein n=1 Tax=Sansalvadorimonas verongulae TaxID=2172824 RepID=UPI0012BBACF5|nr:hypothetical protein [Sansalvadorimonas verongulae]MTI12787.1 hypothetical protein [Sansalvadorimonas verongulae]
MIKPAVQVQTPTAPIDIPGKTNSGSSAVTQLSMTYAGPGCQTPPAFKPLTPPAGELTQRSITSAEEEVCITPAPIPPGGSMVLPRLVSNLSGTEQTNSENVAPLDNFSILRDDDQDWSAAEVFQGVIDSFEDDDLRLKHHLAHRATLSTLFLGASGVVRWLGLSAIEEMFQGFHMPPFVASPLAIATTAMSYLTTNLLGVYAVNHMPFEGISHRWQLLSGTVALVPSMIDSIAGYVALSTLGLGAPVALAGAGISFLGNIFYYWNFVDRLPFILKGQNDAKEMLAERAKWLQDDIAKELEKPEIKEIADKTALCKELAKRLIRPRAGECLQRLLPIASKSHRNRNIIAEIKAAQAGRGDLVSVKALEDDAVKARTKGCNRVGQLGLLTAFSLACSGFTWSDNSPSVNSLLTRYYPTMVCASAAQTAYYAAAQGCAQVFSVAETIATGVLSFDNAKILSKSIKSGLCNTWRKASKADVAMFTLGISASLCYTLTIYGAVRKDLEEDPCLGGVQPALYILPIIGATAGFLHTWMIGPELKGVKNAVKDLGVNIYRSIKATCSRTGAQTPTEQTPLLIEEQQRRRRTRRLEESEEAALLEEEERDDDNVSDRSDSSEDTQEITVKVSIES